MVARNKDSPQVSASSRPFQLGEGVKKGRVSGGVKDGFIMKEFYSFLLPDPTAH